MPKRPCPFEESFGPDAKMQVGAGGARRWTKRKEVYDHTLTLLFAGAKNATNALEAMDAMPTTTATTTTTSPTSSSSSLQQLLLTPHGTLAKPPPDTQTTVQCVPGALSQPAALSACVGCRRVSTELWGSCRYCECKLCEACQRACHFCGGSFCPKCSLSVYLHEERVVCLSCC